MLSICISHILYFYPTLLLILRKHFNALILDNSIRIKGLISLTTCSVYSIIYLVELILQKSLKSSLINFNNYKILRQKIDVIMDLSKFEYNFAFLYLVFNNFNVQYEHFNFYLLK